MSNVGTPSLRHTRSTLGDTFGQYPVYLRPQVGCSTADLFAEASHLKMASGKMGQIGRWLFHLQCFLSGILYGADGTPKVLVFADDSNLECRFSPAPSSAAPTPTLQDSGC